MQTWGHRCGVCSQQCLLGRAHLGWSVRAQLCERGCVAVCVWGLVGVSRCSARLGTCAAGVGQCRQAAGTKGPRLGRCPHRMDVRSKWARSLVALSRHTGLAGLRGPAGKVSPSPAPPGFGCPLGLGAPYQGSRKEPSRSQRA